MYESWKWNWNFLIQFCNNENKCIDFQVNFQWACMKRAAFSRSTPRPYPNELCKSFRFMPQNSHDTFLNHEVQYTFSYDSYFLDFLNLRQNVGKNLEKDRQFFHKQLTRKCHNAQKTFRIHNFGYFFLPKKKIVGFRRQILFCFQSWENWKKIVVVPKIVQEIVRPSVTKLLFPFKNINKQNILNHFTV